MANPIIVGIALARLILAAHRSGHGVLLMGATGVGKTAIIKDIATKVGIGFRRLDVSVMEPSDLGGIPVPQGNKMAYLRPAWMPDLPGEPEGIAVIEEATRAHPSVKNGLMNLISEKQINGHVLPPRWSIHATANPATAEYDDAVALDAAFAARFSIIDVRASRQEWLTWAKANDVHPAVINFITTNPGVF